MLWKIEVSMLVIFVGRLALSTIRCLNVLFFLISIELLVPYSVSIAFIIFSSRYAHLLNNLCNNVIHVPLELDASSSSLSYSTSAGKSSFFLRCISKIVVSRTCCFFCCIFSRRVS